MSDWPHSPVHRLAEAGAYMVTCGTYLKRHHFQSSERLGFLCEALQRLAAKYGWNLQAWAVFSNHYHWVGLSPPDPAGLRSFVSQLHTETSTALNVADHTPGRRVWFQYWETRQRSYFARLSYVHRNAVHHRVSSGTVALPVVFCGMVRAEGQRVVLQNHHGIRDQAAEDP